MSLEELIPSNHAKSYLYSIFIRTGLVLSTLFIGLSVPFFGESSHFLFSCAWLLINFTSYYFFTKSENYLYIDQPREQLNALLSHFRKSLHCDIVALCILTANIIFSFTGLVMSLIGSLLTMLVVSSIQFICSCS